MSNDRYNDWLYPPIFHANMDRASNELQFDNLASSYNHNTNSTCQSLAEKQLINGLSKVWKNRLVLRLQRDIDSDDDSLQDDLDLAIALGLSSIYRRRYLFRNKYRVSNRKTQTFIDDLGTGTEEPIPNDSGESSPPWLSDAEFKQKYRVDRDSFNKIHDKI